MFLPPLLHAAGFSTSPQELRAEKAALSWLAGGLVLLTMGAVAVVAHALVDGMSWPAAFVLGAVVAPTDPLSAAATFTRIPVPERVRVLVEGEAMLNDATALVAYRIALAAAVTGTFAPGEAAVDFLASALGGIAIGLAVGFVEVRVLRRQADRPLTIFLTVGAAYGAYIAAEEAGVSGVLAAVTSGIYLGWFSHVAFDADTRLSAVAFWEVLVFGLNAMLFTVLGLQFPGLVDDLRGQVSLENLTVAAVVVSLTVIGVRLAGQFFPGAFPGGSWRERLVVGWSGMRGAISLAAALSIPLSVDARPQIVFLTFVVLLVTLVGQGLTLPALLRVLDVEGPRPWSPDEAIARLEAAQAALDRLDELEEEGVPEELLRRLRDLYRARFRACMAVLGGRDGHDGRPPADPRERYAELRRDLIGVERDTLLRLRRDGRIRQETLRQIQRDLDLEDARLRT
ncbi:MAG: monovalent cation/hydrogen antiporter [Solirubrobacteraceae bacterium]|nr:monovalent cation/hydrogen antiporter [Solirubrobacteraceae bacterium]